jgi:hypothetical protein
LWGEENKVPGQLFVENKVPGQLFVGSNSVNEASGNSPLQDQFFIGAAGHWRSANASFDRIRWELANTREAIRAAL